MGVRISLFEQLPVPFGLVRFGVAPDHQDVKKVTERFTQIASDARVNYFGNVSIGSDFSAAPEAARLSLAQLQEHYDAVVLTYGASANRGVGLPGAGLAGVHSARQFVEWYNGHPRAAGLDFRLSDTETAVIVGHGNVALDCARILCKSVEQLRSSDIAQHAAHALAASKVQKVVLLGRRGVLHAAFTIKELRELSRLAGVHMSLDAPADAFSEAVMAAAASDRPRARLTELLRGIATAPPTGVAAAARSLQLHFQKSPTAFVAAAEEARVAAVRTARTRLEPSEPGPRQRAASVSALEDEMACGLVLTSVGYRSEPLEGAPFDEGGGVVPSSLGRVAQGLYVSGWLRRGPSGVILTNVGDAAQVAASVFDDWATGQLKPAGKEGECAVRHILRTQAVPVVDFAGWLRIDAEEVRRGARVGKPREKIISVSDMLDVVLS